MDEKAINKLIKKITLIIIGLIIFIWCIFNLNYVGDLFNTIQNIFQPFLFGIIIALILNAPVRFLEKKLTKKDKKGNIVPNKELAVGLSVISVILIIIIVFVLVIPELIEFGKITINNSPIYNEKITEFINDVQEKYPSINVNGIANQLNNYVQDVGNSLKDDLPQIVSNSISTISGTFLGIVNFCMGIAFSVMILIEGERIKIAIKKLLYTFLKKNVADKIIKVANIFKESFSNFVVAQSINSLAVGLLCVFIGLIAGVPNAVQAGILVGITSLIPMFGALIGILLSVVLIVVISPVHALIFFVASIIIWLIGENIFKPILVGKKLGMPGLLQFLSVIVGGALFGFLGVLLGIPVVHTIYILLYERTKETKIE